MNSEPHLHDPEGSNVQVQVCFNEHYYNDVNDRGIVRAVSTISEKIRLKYHRVAIRPHNALDEDDNGRWVIISFLKAYRSTTVQSKRVVEVAGISFDLVEKRRKKRLETAHCIVPMNRKKQRSRTETVSLTGR